MNLNKQPMVSVYITTYYHEKYIEQAIKSVINQKRTFPIEIVISDDASKDRTPEILREYEKKYSFISVHINTFNIGLTANMYLVKSLCKGKYICDLSGDDYWIDEYKLQKQVDFLENNLDYYSVCTRIEMREDFNSNYKCLIPNNDEIDRDFTLDMFLNGKNLPMNGIMMRNPFLNDKDIELFSIMPRVSPYIDDLTDNLLILSKGKSYILPDCSVAYRVRKTIKGDHNYNSINKKMDSYKKHIDLLNNLHSNFGDKYNLFNRYRIVTFSGMKNAIKYNKLVEFKEVYLSIPKKYKKMGLFKSVLLMIPKKIIDKIKKSEG